MIETMTMDPSPPRHGDERMSTLTIYGASDDLVEMDGIKGADEFNVYPESGTACEWLVTGADGVLRIVAFYDRLGVWHFSVAQAEEGVPIPSWPLTITTHECGYSTLVTIDVPEPAFVSRLL